VQLNIADVIRLENEDGMFVIVRMWSDTEVLVYGGRIIKVSDVAEVVDSEEIADALLDSYPETNSW
jgi:hypothetical protein